MKTVSFTIGVQAPKAALFGYLSDPNNLPEWANEFCQELMTTADGYRVNTPMGPMGFRIAANASTGVIDMLTRKGDGPEETLPTRVLTQPGDRSAWVVTFTPPSGLPEDGFVAQCASIEREMGNVQRLFTLDGDSQMA